MPVLEARGVELVWERVGPADTPALVLVHESATGRAAWRPLAQALAGRGLGAVLYDRRGWGESGAPDGYSRTTVEEQSEDLAELVAATGGGPAAVCGAGLGGLIALDLLLRRTELVSAAALVEPLVPGLVPEATELLSTDRETLRDAVQESGAAGMVDAYLEGRLAALGSGAERLPAEACGAARERPGSLAAELGAAGAWSHPIHDLGEVGAPVAVVTCADSPPLLRGCADALAGRLGSAERGEIAGPGPPHLRSTEALAEAVSSAVPR